MTEKNTEPTLLLEKAGGVATLTLNRPAARNALTAAIEGGRPPRTRARSLGKSTEHPAALLVRLGQQLLLRFRLRRV